MPQLPSSAKQQEQRHADNETVQHTHKVSRPVAQQGIAKELAEIGAKCVVNTQPERFGTPADPEFQFARMDPAMQIEGPSAGMAEQMSQPGKHRQHSHRAAHKPAAPGHALPLPDPYL